MLDKSGMSPDAASQAMGRPSSYLEQALKRKGGIGAPALAEIAQSCGYELLLVGRGETLHIDPAHEDEAENAQKKPRKGSFPLYGNPSITWDPFIDGQELLAITEPYESPTFYHIGQHDDGTWHVLSVEKHDYAQEGEEALKKQLARVGKMRRLLPNDEGRKEVIDSLCRYVYDESPEAKGQGRGALEEDPGRGGARADRGQECEISEARKAASRAQAKQSPPIRRPVHHVWRRQVTASELVSRTSRQNGP